MKVSNEDKYLLSLVIFSVASIIYESCELNRILDILCRVVLLAIYVLVICFYIKKKNKPFKEWHWRSKLWFEFLNISGAYILLSIILMMAGKI